MFKRNLLQSFKFALDGLIFVFNNERNMRLHCAIAIVVSLAAAYMKISSVQWFFLLFAIAFVLITETVNTAFELLLDYINGKKYHSTVKMLKDIAAGGVLIASVNALIVGIIIFLPLIINKL
ncbi:MAG: hypothetical protein COV72_03000 [Candidatus Omnitrophica bacterium CG11_big_fil_rev_8_21_14_0_20_42_13]|uniref:Diacylglycerol kinase n=1 Tax=Candidatus Ghiorseimicrobium undicola TaxID=1974746 RepID=A0A2H0LYI4_9BACT|nr:MAG: hypothetical protein COV72_03000 [Candidatus Omnitrophica bacterium CG11_big_fil_rev_8_21_14_0_20_42_13]